MDITFVNPGVDYMIQRIMEQLCARGVFRSQTPRATHRVG